MCNNIFSKFIGFMFKKEFKYALLFKRCNSIHTFFMKENIDVVMTDKNNKIIFYYPNLGPNKIILPKKGAYNTYEFPINKLSNIQIGEILVIEKR